MPAPWCGKRVVLQPAATQTWSQAEVGGKLLERDSQEDWLAGPALNFGQWNTLHVHQGSLHGARLVVSESLHISSLEASVVSGRSLSVRVHLAQAGAVILFLTLSAEDGCQVGSLEVASGLATRDLEVELPVTETLQGYYRLKASLVVGGHVVDNARLDLST